jgi:hypothetical protein
MDVIMGHVVNVCDIYTCLSLIRTLVPRDRNKQTAIQLQTAEHRTKNCIPMAEQTPKRSLFSDNGRRRSSPGDSPLVENKLHLSRSSFLVRSGRRLRQI